MSKTNKIFSSIPVPVPDRSGFDLSHESLGTATTGTVVPVTHFEVLPGDTISLGSMLRVTLPPFAVPFMGRIDAELTAAFIPYRLIWSGWERFITQNPGVLGIGNMAPNSNNVPLSAPIIGAYNTINNQYNSQGTELSMYARGTLADYLGVKPFVTSGAGGNVINGPLLPTGKHISALPFLAYHKFCDDWIRDENIMKPYFFEKIVANTVYSEESSNYVAPFQNICSYAGGRFSPNLSAGYASTRGPETFYLSPVDTSASNGAWSPTLAGVPVDWSLGLGSLRQRCFAKDYFTTATPRPQSGAAAQVVFDTSQTSGGFTIAALRAANSLQKWMERNNIAGTDYGSQILAHFGVTPPSATMNRSVLLGSVRTPVVVNAVENNSNAELSAGSTKNPFGTSLGSAAGFGSAAETGRLVDNFDVKEHGIIMVFFTLIPHAYYNSGLDRQMIHNAYGDWAWPEFAGIGDQEIYVHELNSNAGATGSQIFGYNQRYSEFKFKLDRISGLLQDGENLSVYALQRGFSTSPALGSDFLEIPKDYLDQVFAVTTAQSGFSCIYDCYFDCSALRVLPEYSLPKL